MDNLLMGAGIVMLGCLVWCALLLTAELLGWVMRSIIDRFLRTHR